MLFIILRFEFEAENTLIEKEVHAWYRVIRIMRAWVVNGTKNWQNGGDSDNN